jgi:potassium/chloride transporter 4/5/6
MGTLRGVFLPCLQNIIGIILFVRMPWIIGVAGIGLTLVILLMGISCTLLTTMSMSAIATNGMVAAGGAYYMISRSLGKELGVSVGLLFFLSTSVSIAVYMVGAVEILVDYISRDIGSFIISRVNQTRFFGTLLLMLLTIASLFGMRFSGRASLFFLTGLIVSMVAIYVGIFSSNRPGVPTEVIVGFPGDFNENFGPGFRKEDMNGNVADVDFFKLFAIFFPSVTGIMSGSNRSGSLKEPGVSIPKGTFAAIGTTGILYFLFIALMGTVCTGEFLRTRLSPYGLPVAVVSWPDGLVTLIGCLLTCIGAGLQCLAGASRVMQSIARDDVIPWLSFFKVTHKGEPRRALILTFFIAEAIILIGNLDIVALVSTAFFLVCYASINFSTALLSILKYPHWRPSWKYYHWSLSLLGMILCVTYMFFINWIAALLSLIAVAALYKYVEYTGAQVEWGNGMYALNLHVAQKNLLILEKTRNSSARNWRPQIMCFLDLDENQLPRNPELLSFTSQLRKAGGLSVITSVVVGDLVEKAVSKEISEIYDTLVLLMREQKIEGFPQVLVSKDPVEGRLNALQTVGIGVLRPNTVLMSYPSNWSSYSRKDRDGYVQVLKSMIACEYVVLLLKSDNKLFPFPSNSQAPMGEEDKIDVYWIMHDGGILTLIPYLMRKHRIWRRAKLRIFCVAQMKDNSIQMKADLEALLKRFRIEAEARVVEIQDYDISEFAYEKTIRMQKRNEMLQNMNLLNSQNEVILVLCTF